MSKSNVLVLCLLSAATLFAGPEHGSSHFQANLSGYAEVPAVVTTGSAEATITVASDESSLTVTLKFTKLAGTPSAAGLYLGLPATTGGLIAPLCGASPLPACTSDTSITTTIKGTDIAGISAQGLNKGDLASVIKALSTGAVYLNVVTSTFPNGEIRGQVIRGFGFLLGGLGL